MYDLQKLKFLELPGVSGETLHIWTDVGSTRYVSHMRGSSYIVHIWDGNDWRLVHHIEHDLLYGLNRLARSNSRHRFWDEQVRKIEAGYVNADYPVRSCDFCGKPYNGPAVYCSHDCAMMDAQVPEMAPRKGLEPSSTPVDSGAASPDASQGMNLENGDGRD